MPGDDVPLPGDAPIPMPGDDAIPLPGDDGPLPGESIPMPGSEESAVPVAAAPSLPFEFRGYVENTTNIEYDTDAEEDILLNAGRVRVNLSGEPDRSLDFGIGLVGTMNTGATSVDLLRYMPDAVRKQIVPGAEALFGFQMDEDDLFVQEAFGTLYADHFRLRVGRHKFYTGTGYAFNPIDLFNVKNPLDPTYEVNGLDAALLTLDLPRQIQLQALALYDDQVESSGYLARLKGYVGGWDVAAQYSHVIKQRVDWQALNSEAALEAFTYGASFDSFVREFRWHMPAVEFAGELWEWGLYGEGGYVFAEAIDDAGTLIDAAGDHERLLLGLDHTFEFQLYVMLEYLRLGQGRADTADITLNDRMAYFSGEILSTNRDTLFTGLSYPLSDLIEGSLYGMFNLNDGSILLNPWVIYDVRPGLTLSLSANIPLGEQDSQMGNAGPGGFARLKWNF